MLKIKLFVYIIFFIFSNLTAQDIRINEFLTSNINGYVDKESGEFSDWIELYNSTDSLIDLSGFFLTDNLSDSIYWQFSRNTFMDPNSYLIIWADGKNSKLHSSFKLDNDGEQIFLLDSKSSIIDSISYGKQREDISYGRVIKDSSEWGFFAEPTPGYENDSTFYTTRELSREPEYSYESGFYNSNIKLEFDLPENGRVFYTSDGSIPTISAGELYSDFIQIDSTTVIRAISVQDSLLPSKIISHSFFINEETDLPVISITTDPQNLWDDEIGINTIGTNGISLWGVNANYWQDWERPIKVEYFDEDKTLAFEQNGGIAINGARRNMLQRSFRIFARKKYGNTEINYKMFDEKEIRTFSSLVLRNGGYPEYRFTMFRDGFMQNLLPNEMDLDYQAYKPSILYLNGKYWGIYNIREKQNEDYLKENRGVDPENVDILEQNMTVIEGDNLHYKNMISFIESHDLSIKENYDSVLQWIDIENFINYQIAQLYFANIDWPGNNVKYWRPKTSNGKWKWILFDVDGGFGLNADYNFNSMEYVTDENSEKWNNAPWSTFLFRNLIINQKFKFEFIQRFAAHLSYSFHPETVIGEINKFQNKIETEFPKHIERWATDCSSSNPESKDGCLFDNINTWYNNVEVMRDFALQRPGYLISNLKDYFSLEDPYNFTVTAEDENNGDVFVNGVRVRYGIKASLFPEDQLIVEAKPRTGFKFVGWEGTYPSADSSLQLILDKDIYLIARFEPVILNKIPSVIISEFQLNIENSPYSTDSDIYVYENANLIVDPGVEINMPDGASIYVFGSLNIKGTKNDHVTLKSRIINEKWGSINFINSTNKSILSHVDISGTTNGKDNLTQVGGISSYNSDIELNYVNLHNVQFPIYVEYGNFIMRNSKIHTKVTSDYVNVKYGSAIIENCEFVGDYAIDTDAIDYDDVTYGVIRRNRIYDFLGHNSDAIDIGEGTKDVLIEENLIDNCSDKGISIGQSSTAIIRGNVITNCNLGIGIKDNDSYGVVDHNTFYNNNISVSCFEKVIGRGGGKADITNTIFSNSVVSDTFVDEFSEINIKYSLSDKILLSGEGNIFASPEFINADSMDFRVSQNSLTIDAGDPEFVNDPDGSRTNIGASFHDFYNDNNIIITEINYHSSDEFNPKDWIEFFNPNKKEVDISGWIFKDSDDEHRFIFQNQIISPNGFLILSEDISDFKKIFFGVNNVVGNLNFGLNNSGETIRLYDNNNNLIDSLTYDDEAPWPQMADGEGYTLQLVNSDLDNNNHESWGVGQIYGSPADSNIIVGLSNNIGEIPRHFALEQNYPNPFNPSTRIRFSLPESAKVSIKIFDILGKLISTVIDEKKDAGVYEVEYNYELDHITLSSGIYFYRLSTSNFQKTRKMILVK